MSAIPSNLHETLPGFGRLLWRFWPYLRRQQRQIVIAVLALLAEVTLRLLEPWPLKFVFDQIIPGGAGQTNPLPTWLVGADPGLLLGGAAGAVVAITALRAVAAYWNTVGFTAVGNTALTQVRAQVYAHLQRLSLSFHTDARGGDLVVRVIGDVGQLKDVAVTALLPLLVNLLILVSMVALMLWMNWQLTLLALTTLPLFALTTLRLGKRIQEAARKQRRREGAMAATAAETLGAIRVVQALSLEERLAESFTSQNKESLKQDAKAARLSAGLERGVDILVAVATGLVLWYGAQLVLRHSLTPGELLVFLTYLRNAFKPVRDLAKYTGRLAKATAAGERVLDLLEREPEVRNRPDAVPAPPFQGAVRFDRVGFAYQPGHPVLRTIDLAVPPGRHVALVGPSGHGKTTLLSLLLRLYDPVEGRVLLDGHDIRGYTLESLRAQISVVMQDTILFAASVRDNIAYGVPGATEEEIVAAARLASAHEFITALPQGYDTILGERGVTLSNGQRQRIAIARAAIRNAPIIILDEPTTGLDEANARLVMEALERLTAGRTTFLITHALSQAQRADLIVVLEEGRIVEQGSPAELLGSAGRYARWYALQARLGEEHAWAALAPPAAAPAPDEAAEPLFPERDVIIPVSTAEGNHGIGQAPSPAGPEELRRLPPARGTRHEDRRRLLFAGIGLLLVGLLLAGLVALGAGRPAEPSSVRGTGAPATFTVVVLGALPSPTDGAATAVVGATNTAPAGVAASPAIPTSTVAATPLATAQAVGAESRSGDKTVLTFSGPLTSVVGVDWAPDNRTLALASIDQLVRLLDTTTGQVTFLPGHTGAVFQVRWSPDGRALASAGADDTVRLWSPLGRPLATLTDPHGLSNLAWSPAGQVTTLTSGVDFVLWGLDGSRVARPAKGSSGFTTLAWAPDGQTLAGSATDQTVHLWAPDGTAQATLFGHTSAVWCLAWAPDGLLLAAGADDGTIRLWGRDGAAKGTLTGHTGFVNSVAWSPDGQTLASAAGDDTVRLWRRDGTPLATLTGHTGDALGVAWSPDGRTLASVGADNTVRLWR